MKTVLGIDVSKEKLDVYAIFDGKIRKKIIPNSEKGFLHLQSWLKRQHIDFPHVCMEATGCYYEEIAEFLYNSGFTVSVVNPLKIKSFRSCKLVRQKTDSTDAQIIAEFCLQNNPAAWSPKPQEIKELHQLSVRIRSLQTEINRASNMLENKRLSQKVLESVKTEVDFLKKMISDLEKEAQKIVDENPDLKLKFEALTSICGVGPKTALMILSGMPDVSNFQNASQYAAFVGVTPSHFQSGSSVHGHSHISKIGSVDIRKPLYMSALVVKNINPHFQKFVQKLQSKGKAPKVIVVAIMRKLMRIFFGMLKNLQKYDNNLAFAS